jgi:glycosyltransferase involved in cell wall biosynthesis
MKLLFLIDNLGSGGAQRQMVTLACALKKRNYDIVFLIYNDKKFYKEILEQNSIAVYEICSHSNIDKLNKIRRFIQKYKPNLVLAYLDGPSMNVEIVRVSFLGKRKWGLIVSERGLIHPRPLKWIDIFRNLHRIADYVFTNSYTNHVQMLTNAPWLKEKSEVIYNLVDDSRFYPCNEKKQDNSIRIVIVAHLSPIKNILRVLDAVALIKDDMKFKNAVIEWVGEQVATVDPVYAQACIKRVIQLGIGDVFKFSPPSNCIENVYRQCDAVGLFSLSESLPNSVCEGMCCGKPIIATRVSDLPHLVTDGYNGYLCDSEDVQSIAHAILKFINISLEERENMAENCFLRARELFNFEISVKHVSRLVEKYALK